MTRDLKKYAVWAVIFLLIAAGAFGALFSQGQSKSEGLPTGQAALAVPSGQTIAFHDTVMNQPGFGLTARFRFIAPELAALLTSLPYETLEADLAHLCDHYAAPRLDVSPRPSTVVISLSEAPVAFGVAAPDVAQVFEAYALTDQGCEWEAF